MKKIISCKVFEPYIKRIQAETGTVFDVQWIDIKQHDNPKQLSAMIQSEVDNIVSADEILILYGLCGNALIEIVSRSIPLTILKVHDCCTVLMGSKERYSTFFADRLSQVWSCESYSLDKNENYLKLTNDYLRYVKDYGEDNADYILEMLTPKKTEKSVYITFDSKADQLNICKLDSKGTEVINGDLKMLRNILNDEDKKDTLRLYPNEKLEALYDLSEVITKVTLIK